MAPVAATKKAQESLIPLNGEPVAVRATPISVLVLQKAIESNATADTLAKLLELQERWEANEARKAFVSALAAFKSNPPKLEKIKQVNFPSNSGKSNVNYHYAPLDYICSTIGESLGKHGLSFTWNVDQSDVRVKVTCILRHEQGHSESVTMVAALHDDQRMNAIQRLGATITYLERYSLLAATGLATADQDTDGMTMGNGADFIANIADAGNLQELGLRYKEAVGEALRAKDPAAVKAFMAAREKREKELNA